MQQRAARTAAVLVAVGTFALVGAACGSDDDKKAEPAATVATSTTTSTTTIPIDHTVYGDAVTQVVSLGGDPAKTNVPGPVFLSARKAVLWVGMHRTSSVIRVDATTGAVIKTISIDPAPGSTKPGKFESTGAATGTGCVIATDDAVWVLDLGGFVWRIDPKANEIVARVEVPGLLAESGTAVGDGYLWFMTKSGYGRIDVETNKLAGQFLLAATERVPGPSMTAMPGAVWTVAGAGIVRIDARSGEIVTTIPIGGSPAGVHDGLVWGSDVDKVFAIDPETNARVKVTPKPANVKLLPDVTVADGALWTVAPPADDADTFYKLERFDLAAEKWSDVDLLNREFRFTIGLSVEDGTAWASDFGRGAVMRVPQN
jgi:streptogramin lyase